MFKSKSEEVLSFGGVNEDFLGMGAISGGFFQRIPRKKVLTERLSKDSGES
ncbi:hypothetical protein CWATWH8502_462 [Crocosphaera watsonii WH 8502]|uniref:Uncharacterized protein n=1 Tax=Crocosphaera watsonii WH 8502 TaxID=423474 RepID=T2I9P8_CROWT|nr:hypothetical protein CWATWH8502_462 [Crocosphaera watsonii WH 8502]